MRKRSKIVSKPIKNIMALIKESEWREKNPTFDVDPEIVEIAEHYATIWLERWKKGDQPHWTEIEERNNYIGLLGQKCFEVTLQQLEIPSVYNDPTIDWRGKKNYDFRIPHVGKIEVKTVDWKANQQRLIIKRIEWHSSEFCFALKLLDQKPTRVQFMGYATCKEVDNEFTEANNEWPCPNAPCKWQKLEKLHSASEFFNLLKTKTATCWTDR